MKHQITFTLEDIQKAILAAAEKEFSQRGIYPAETEIFFTVAKEDGDIIGAVVTADPEAEGLEGRAA